MKTWLFLFYFWTPTIQVMIVEKEILKEKGGAVNGKLFLGDMAFDIGDSIATTALPKGTSRK